MADKNDFADLHVHTDRSDGIFSPRKVVEKAVEIGLGAIALTDHDSVDAIGMSIEAAEGQDIEIIPGVEISATKGEGEVHILGYFVDPRDRAFLDFLSVQKRSRVERMEQMLALLASSGITVPKEKVFSAEAGGTVGRLHLARIMAEERLVGDVYEAFDRYIGDGKPCYVGHKKPSHIEAVSIIKDAGGVPVLAHPGGSVKDEALMDHVEAGVMGIEVYHTKHSPADSAKYLAFAEEHGLIATGGSDCHGDTRKGKILLGKVRVGKETVEALRAASEKVKEANRARGHL